MFQEHVKNINATSHKMSVDLNHTYYCSEAISGFLKETPSVVLIVVFIWQDGAREGESNQQPQARPYNHRDIQIHKYMVGWGLSQALTLHFKSSSLSSFHMYSQSLEFYLNQFEVLYRVIVCTYHIYMYVYTDFSNWNIEFDQVFVFFNSFFFIYTP